MQVDPNLLIQPIGSQTGEDADASSRPGHQNNVGAVSQRTTDTRVQMQCIDINKAHAMLGHVNKCQVHLTFRDKDVQIIGTMKPCKACMLAKAKQLVIKRATNLKAKDPGECLFVDTTGPFTRSHEGFKYWVQVVDNATKMGFCFFMGAKSDIGEGLSKVVTGIKKYGYAIKFFRCNNAGENIHQVTDIANKHSIRLEHTAP